MNLDRLKFGTDLRLYTHVNSRLHKFDRNVSYSIVVKMDGRGTHTLLGNRPLSERDI